MEVAPHDLLLVSHLNDMVSQPQQQIWVNAALARAPYVVVRRAQAGPGMVAVGIRGQVRSQRYAAILPLWAFTKRITPEQLAQAQGWKASPRLSTSKALQALISVSDVFRELNLFWGPVGSVGFELASGVPTTTKSSDLDLIMRASERLPLATAQELHARLTAAPVHVDIQIETLYGAFALDEYVREATRIVLRTHHGPRLTYDPWESPEHSIGART